MEIGIFNMLNDSEKCFDHVTRFGLNVCQLGSWDMNLATREIAEKTVKQSIAANVRVSAVWAGVPGPGEWNFREGPTTLGLVPEQYRQVRVEALKKWADFAVWIGAPAIITHCGFIPENMMDSNYEPVVEAIREVAQYCEQRGIEFWFETGQETPVVLLRTIERVGTSNLGINFDPANLILYGKGNPIDALDVIGGYIKNVHVKDGFYPTTGDQLGREVAPGLGKVEFPRFISKLMQSGFNGELIIEREISGEEQINDIIKTIEDLKIWIRQC
ncbi:sugar phosphate isomerase/epimerase family protein [Paenibacillus sp. LHD-117]|uniref:sugar phosphate isomerase/epimerase family protein n=1 Tax=Paenibacillus sp. LHD-117 TaxID=3071412 RepID=UPI0027E00D9E|nr:sugar phosphate isomerase/epimerase family protein [Paenibacillus sp. LHD-117]MDQ6419710.1 sugar phosphate isomerase/epimerase family protein [Paenibacillus sp. LHD-117]